ncbi:MAG: FtsX-like permease family protein [Nitrospirae bacterium]|nr:FtsX-like permease family protein [Nitrospirota bacterium]
MTHTFTLFSLAIRNLERKPLRTAILVLAIGLLVSLLVFALSFVRRVDSGIRITSERLGADLLIVPTGSRGAAEDVLLENKVKTFYMDRGIVERVKKIRGIDRVTEQTYLATITGACCDVPESVVVAFDQDTDFVITPWLGKRLGRLQRGEAIVGSESALNISLGLTEVDSVLFGNVFKMVGVLDKTGTGLDTAIFIDENNIEDIIKKGKAEIKPGKISVILARVKSGYDPYRVAGEIEDTIIETDTVARKDIGKNVLSALRDINRIFFMTIVLTSLLSAFLTWAVFSGIVNERAREVGIMRAIGARESHVMRVFLFEVLVIGGLGSIAGVLCGTVLSVTLAKGFTILRNISTDLGVWERAVIAVSGLLAGTGICVVGALSPIRRLKKTEPLVVLKGVQG